MGFWKAILERFAGPEKELGELGARRIQNLSIGYSEFALLGQAPGEVFVLDGHLMIHLPFSQVRWIQVYRKGARGVPTFPGVTRGPIDSATLVDGAIKLVGEGGNGFNDEGWWSGSFTIRGAFPQDEEAVLAVFRERPTPE